MKKVVNINLNGRAYQVEEDGYEALKSYLDKAEKTLAKNPDKTEILADIEQAVADKCEGELTGGKNVVSAGAVKRVLEKIGPVHEESDALDEDVMAHASTEEPPRKLYRIQQEGKILGVCAGLAAYFATDVTVMRIIFVILAFVTQGFMILVYLVLAIAMPEAKKPEDVAAAYGRPDTAQQIVSKVKQLATDQNFTTRVGMAITTIAQAVAKVAVVLIVFGIVGLTALFIAGVWMVLLGQLEMQGALATLVSWKQLGFIASLYVLLVMPLYWLFRVFESVGKAKTANERVQAHALNITTVVLWSVAMFSALTFVAVYTENFREFSHRNEGYIKAGKYTLCVDKSKCGNYYQYYDENGVLQGRDPSKLDPTITGNWR